MSVKEAIAEAKRRAEVQRLWDNRKRLRHHSAVRRRVNALLAQDWANVKVLALKAEAGGMVESLAHLRAYSDAQRKEKLLMDGFQATLSDSIETFLAVLEKRGFVQCPNCREEYLRLRPESGLCIECDPYKEPVTKKATIQDKLSDILAFDGQE